MSDIQYNLLFKLGGDNQIMAAINKVIGGVNKTSDGVDNLNKKFNSLPSIINKSLGAIKLDAILNNIDRVSSGLNSLSQPGANLSNQMHDLQAITGVAGKKLQEIEGYARASAKTFGGSAADSVESYKLILSQLSPEIAKQPVALKAMGDTVSYTSKLMGGDAVAATNLLTTAMNQYGVSTDDPIKASQTMAAMTNVMAAAAKEGSAELPQIQQAMENAGAAAKGANVSFEETNAAIQVLDKIGFKGAQGGVALRNVLTRLGQGKYIPENYRVELQKLGVDTTKLADKNLTLKERLEVLKPAMKDSALLSAWLGEGADLATKGLINQLPLLDQTTTAITGTNEVYKQAAIVMDSPLEKNKRLQAQVDDFKISLFNASDGMLGYMGVISDVTRDVTNLIPLFSAASNITKVWSGVQAIFNATLWANPITWVVAGVIALTAAIGYVIYKTDGWGKMWSHTVKGAGLLWQSFAAGAENVWNKLTNNISIGLDNIKKGWYEFQNAVGMGDEAGNNKMQQQINADINARKQLITAGDKVVADLSNKAQAEFKAGWDALHWNSNKSDNASGIAPPKQQGATTGDTNNLIANPKDKKKGTGSGKATNDAIATGGTKSTTVNISIGKLVEKMQFDAADLSQGMDKMRDRIVDELTRAIIMGASLGGAS